MGKVRDRPWWSLVSNVLTDEATNRFEFFIHHEDARRAQPGWQPRTMPAGFTEAAWARVRVMAKLVLRRFWYPVTLVAPGHGEVTTPGTKGDRDKAATITGAPEELLIFLFGRQDHALVEITGYPDTVDRLRHATLGI
jgi:uncharacterized protein (TIGR03085 family)